MNRSGRRFHRSLVLILAALGALVWVMLDQFDVPREDVQVLILGSMSLVAAAILGAAVVAGLWIALRKWLGRGD